MSETNTKPVAESSTSEVVFGSWTNGTLAFLVLRLWLALRAIITGIEKFAAPIKVKKPLLDELGMPDPTGAMVEVKSKAYALGNYHAVSDSLKNAFAQEPLLPAFAATIYYACLGAALLILGVMLLLGVGTRISLFGMGLLYISLTYGLILLGQDAGISYLGVHILMVAMALTLAKHNRLAVLSKF
jgi:thiosulfate dehydrogenase [quinone] large subunit